MKRLMREFANARRFAIGSLLVASTISLPNAAQAHDPDVFLKGDQRITEGYTDNGNVEAKRARNTGRGMPSIRGPFPESFGLEFLGQLTNEELGVTRLPGTGAPFLSDIWGWTDQTGGLCHGDEYALVGSSSGVSFVRITDASSGNDNDDPVFLGIAQTSNPNTLLNFWWDIKVWNNWAFWTTEVIENDLGTFDLQRLCEMDEAPPGGVIEADGYVNITLGDDEYLAAHNISVNVADNLGNASSSIAYLTGVTSLDRSVSRDPMWMVNLAEVILAVEDASLEVPAEGALFQVTPVNSVPIPVDSHDAQIVTYSNTGPDAEHAGKEIAILSAGFNQQVAVLDVTDPANPVQIGISDYPGASFSHQGWFDESQTWFFLGDEEDEIFGISDPQNPNLPDTTRTYIFDMTDLETPTLLCHFDAPYAAIDHNMFVKGNYLYQANYTSGITVWEIPAGGPDANMENCGMVEIAHMDTEPRLPNLHMNNNVNIFVGPWGIYPYFNSQKIIASDGLNGLIITRVEE